jgi:hypothetical protein
MVKSARLLFGVMYVPIGVLVHLFFVLTNSQIYSDTANAALLPFYRYILETIIAPNPVVFGIAIIAFELLMGVMIFDKGVLVKIGLVLSIIFQILLAPLGWWGIFNVMLAVLQVPLLREEFEHAIWEVERVQPSMA